MTWEFMQWVNQEQWATLDCTEHLSMPLLTPLDGGEVLLFWSTRDRNNRSWIIGSKAMFEREKLEIDWKSRYVALRPGELGAFDSDGVSCSDILVHKDGRLDLYYFGWQRLEDHTWLNGINVASGRIGEELVRTYRGPILARDTIDPYSVAYPFVSRTQNSKLLYSTFTEYADPRTSLSFKYVARESVFDRELASLGSRTDLLIEEIEGISAYSRPTTFWFGDIAVLLCSVRGEYYEVRGWTYQLGQWSRAKQFDGTSLHGPASRNSTCYQFPFVSGGNTFLLFNGDRYGGTGFGIAKLAS